MDREFRAIIAFAIVMSMFYIAMALHEQRNKHLPEYKEFRQKRFARFHTNYRRWRYFTDVFLKSPNKATAKGHNDDKNSPPSSS